MLLCVLAEGNRQSCVRRDTGKWGSVGTSTGGGGFLVAAGMNSRELCMLSFLSLELGRAVEKAGAGPRALFLP